MSDYGADKHPDLNVARKLVYTDSLVNQDGSNVMQWTCPGDGRVQKIANRKGHTNILFKLDF
jgi:hypothetical protein